MGLPVNGQVGPAVLSDGNSSPLRQGKSGESVVTELHGRYYEVAYRQGLFFAYAAAQTLSVVGTAMTGLIIYNPNSKVNLVLQKIFLQVSVTSATMTGIALAYASQATAPTGVTAATKSGSTMLGVATGQALAYVAATVIAPAAFLPLMHNTAAIAASGVDQMAIDLEGSIVVPPNSIVCLAALGAASAAAALTAGIMYEEVAV